MAPGTLAIATSPDRAHRRILLLTTTDTRSATARVLLVSNRTQMATDFDAIIPAGRATAYDLLVQGELYATIGIDRLIGVVGRVPAQTTAAISRALRTDGASLHGMAYGPPLGGPDDPRRAFKADELGSLLRLTSPRRAGPEDTTRPAVSPSPRTLPA
ncbi:hypothetical protein DVS28_b0032 (plasmid) [Euzebya pacifica]|uniref:Uncharacterized protein n=1 Tax=Euzebya pacifica TaxID=1608957 RepID=A0A346Y5Q5_9ACTN|nr:hypothetical protein [Euzebya pacifica]AXV09802.1 hypothetical protein DVS28_b0032 [Euzebya pacifica]